MTELENGSPFAEAVGRAHSLGFTEPDPREDLSGMDVARKALILARTLGIRMNIEDLAVEPLFPAELSSPDLKVFLQNLRGLDVAWAERIAAARRNHRCIRYVARITPARVTVGLEEVDSDAPLGRLRGSDNQVTITTKRYKQNPLIVSGPGAGAEVTAAGVLNDVLAIALSEGLAVRGRRPKR
jgi:homoserine dehydrogenase